MDINPKISVIITTYNRPILLRRAICSVLNQTYQNIEIIIVNDASTDNTEEVIKSFKDTRIRYILHEKNQKLAASRNSGIKIAQGDFICFLDDDDEIHPLKIEYQLKKFSGTSSNTGIVYCGWQYIFNNKIVSKYFPKNRGNVFYKFLENSFIVVHAPLIRKECFKKIGGFDTTLKSCEDWDLWIRISEHFEFDYVSEIFATVYIHPSDRMSLSLHDKISARKAILAKYINQLKNYPKAYSTQLGRLGVLEYLNNQERIGFKNICKAIKNDYCKLKNYLYIVLILCDLIMPGILERFVIEHYGHAKIYY